MTCICVPQELFDANTSVRFSYLESCDWRYQQAHVLMTLLSTEPGRPLTTLWNEYTHYGNILPICSSATTELMLPTYASSDNSGFCSLWISLGTVLALSCCTSIRTAPCLWAEQDMHLQQHGQCWHNVICTTAAANSWVCSNQISCSDPRLDYRTTWSTGMASGGGVAQGRTRELLLWNYFQHIFGSSFSR